MSETLARALPNQDIGEPIPARRRTSRAAKVITCLAVVGGAAAATIIGSGEHQIAGTPTAASAPAKGKDGTASSAPQVPPAPPTDESAAPLQINVCDQVPVAQIETLFELPSGSLGTDICGSPQYDIEAPAGVPVPESSGSWPLHENHFATVTVYKDQSYAAAVKRQAEQTMPGTAVVEPPREIDGMRVTEIPMLKTVETSFGHDGHTYYIDAASDAENDEAMIHFLGQVVADVSGR